MPPYHPNCLEALIHVTYPRSLTKIANTNHTSLKPARFGLGGLVTGAPMPGGKVSVTFIGVAGSHMGPYGGHMGAIWGPYRMWSTTSKIGFVPLYDTFRTWDFSPVLYRRNLGYGCYDTREPMRLGYRDVVASK